MSGRMPGDDAGADILAGYLESGEVDEAALAALDPATRAQVQIDLEGLALVRIELQLDDTWSEPAADLEARVLAATATAGEPADDSRRPAVSARAVPAPTPRSEPGDASLPALAPVTELEAARRQVRRLRYAVFAVAAVAVIAIAGTIAGFTRDEQIETTSSPATAPPATEAPRLRRPITPTELAPDVVGEVSFAEGDSGLKIWLDITGLPKCDPNKVYEGWVRTEQGPVSVGTFYDSGRIVLWSGVELEEVTAFAVSLQDKGSPTPSGQRVLSATMS